MPASITLRDVCVDLPIYHLANRSLKKQIMWRGSGGAMAQDSAHRLCVQALDGINLDIRHGDRIGLIGPNGAGKTTLLRVLAGVYEPTRGRIHSVGRIVPVFDVGFGMDPDATGYENIALRGMVLGMSRRELRGKVEEVGDFTELGSYLDMPIRTYSSGMLMRLAFGISTCMVPEILLLDEWLMAGDMHFLDKARQRMTDFVGRASIIVLASHTEKTMRQWCDKGLYLKSGKLQAFGPIDDVLSLYNNDIDQPIGPETIDTDKVPQISASMLEPASVQSMDDDEDGREEPARKRHLS